jgi:hypothetical protein
VFAYLCYLGSQKVKLNAIFGYVNSLNYDRRVSKAKNFASELNGVQFTDFKLNLYNLICRDLDINCAVWYKLYVSS